MKQEIPVPISGGLILSYKCNAVCRHCMYGCSPGWSADWISEEDLEIILEQLAQTIAPSPYGPDKVTLSHGLHFTGGEPFLNFDLLCKAVQMAESLKIPSTFVETNCFWCRTDEETRDKLLYLRTLGLKGILISVNPFYLEYVPFERTKRCIRISSEIFEHNMMVYQIEFFRRFQKKGIKDRLPLAEYIEMEGGLDFLNYMEFFMMGRAVYGLGDLVSSKFPRYKAKQLFKSPCIPTFLRNWHNHFDNYGNYIPGFCGGITLGDCRNLMGLLTEGIDLTSFPILKFLIEQDFKSFFHFTKDLGYQEDPEGYFSKCHLCLDMRKYLIKKEYYFQELKPKEFYEHLEDV